MIGRFNIASRVLVIFGLTCSHDSKVSAFAPTNKKRLTSVPIRQPLLQTFAFAEENEESAHANHFSRRNFVAASTLVPFTNILTLLEISNAADIPSTRSTNDAKITNTVFIDLKGLPLETESETYNETPSRITIGLFGDDAPQATQIISQLMTREGYLAQCKPKEQRTLQREQLEANKVYNGCIETQQRGVTYDLSSVWRVIPNERIDLGAVSGKFVSRQNPDFRDSNDFKHDQTGVVSVRRGNDSGFGFTIYPGVTGGNTEALDADHIVIGRVVEGLDTLAALNAIPVVQNTLGKGGATRSAPSRACRYGSQELFCNEFKPLKKILISRTGTM